MYLCVSQLDKCFRQGYSMTAKGKMVTLLLTVHKQSLPFGQETSVTTVRQCQRR